MTPAELELLREALDDQFDRCARCGNVTVVDDGSLEYCGDRVAALAFDALDNPFAVCHLCRRASSTAVHRRGQGVQVFSRPGTPLLSRNVVASRGPRGDVHLRVTLAELVPGFFKEDRWARS